MRALAPACVVLLLVNAAASGQRPGAEATAAELLASLARDEDATASMVELRRRGAGVAAELAESLRGPHLGDFELIRARERALRILFDLREAGVPAVPGLVACLRDPELSDWIVQGAAVALVRIAPFAAASQRELLDALPRGTERRSGWRREWLAHWEALISSLAFDAHAAGLPELVAALEGDDPHARNAACAALVARAPELVEHRESIVAALRAELARPISSDKVWRWRADGVELSSTTSAAGWRSMQTELARALHAYAETDESAYLAVCQELWDLDPERRLAAARWLGDRRIVDAGPWLCLVAEDLNAPPTALAAIDAMRRIGPELAYLAPRLLAVAARARGNEAVQASTPRLAALARTTAHALEPSLESRAPVRGRVELIAAGVDHAPAIDVAAERARVIAWLDRDQGAARLRLRQDERVIAEYHGLRADQGGPQSARIRWLPLRVLPDEFRPGCWERPDEFFGPDCVVAAPAEHVGPGLARHREVPWIVVLVPSDTDRRVFRAEDLSGFQEGVDRFQRAVVRFGMHREAAPGFEALLRDARASRQGVLVAVDGLVIACAPPLFVSSSQCAFTLRPGCDERLVALRTRIE